jgi:hypothetical protein
MDAMTSSYESVIDEICGLNWPALSQSELWAAAWAYYYFSVQFRENLEIALGLHPTDDQLIRLAKEECNTDNLSPWPGVAALGERLNHDEFMARVLRLSPIDRDVQSTIEAAGRRYLFRIREVSNETRAISIASYECGGLESVFKAILQSPHWDTPLLEAFRHFLMKHILFDSSPEHGHGALCEHLAPDDRIRCLWVEFRELLVTAVPRLVM